MKLNRRWSIGLVVGILCLPVIYKTYVWAVHTVERYTSGGSQIYELASDGSIVHAGPLRAGNHYTGASATLPTTTTGPNFSRWVPVYNVGTAVTQGVVLIASNTGTGYVAVSGATNDLTTVVGVAAESIASGAIGWMIPRGGGFAIVNATGTVAIGEILVTTNTYAGGAGVDITPTTGADFATAMSAKTGASAGQVLAILH